MARGNISPAPADVDIVTGDELDTPAPDTNPATATKEPARPAVPEGYVSPVNFAKALSEQLGKEIKPQVIYSYIKNGGKENKLPTYEEGGRANLLKLDEALAWWTAKDTRVAAQKEAAAVKAAAKAERAANKSVTETTPAEDTPVVEAE